MKKALLIIPILATLAIAENTVHYDTSDRSKASSGNDKVHYDRRGTDTKPLSTPNHPSAGLYGK